VKQTKARLDPTCGLFLSLVALSAPHGAEAANRTACYFVQIYDQRGICPGEGDDGVRRAGHYALSPDPARSDAVGFRLELWDKDSSGGDDFIMTVVVGGEGRRCATFNWEGSDAQIGDSEAHPDVYVKVRQEVRATDGTGVIVGARTEDDGAAFPVSSFRSCGGAGGDLCVAVDCLPGHNCEAGDGIALITSVSPFTEAGNAIRSIDSAQRTLEVFGDQINDSLDTDFFFFDRSAIDLCEGPSGCTGDRATVLEAFQGADDCGVASHEMGHVLQMREFVPQDKLRSDCSEGGWDPTEETTDSCATSEGWAMYVSAVSWFDPEETSDTTSLGDDLEKAAIDAPSCSVASGMPIQVAKAFWDMDDAANESGVGTTAGDDDSSDLATRFLLNQWDDFPDGLVNRADFETGEDGVNIWDYRFNAPIGDEETFIDHNCLRAQATN
jgi:hypothetical protein